MKERSVHYFPFGQEILAELERLKKQPASGGRKYSLGQLAIDAGIDPAVLNKHCTGKKKPQLQTVMRYIAVLAPSPDRADVILRSAGYDITYDHDIMCPNYRAIRDYISKPMCSQDDTLIEIGKLLGDDAIIYDRYERKCQLDRSGQ